MHVQVCSHNYVCVTIAVHERVSHSPWRYLLFRILHLSNSDFMMIMMSDNCSTCIQCLLKRV